MYTIPNHKSRYASSWNAFFYTKFHSLRLRLHHYWHNAKPEAIADPKVDADVKCERTLRQMLTTDSASVSTQYCVESVSCEQ